MSYKKADYLVELEWYGNDHVMYDEHKLYKTLLVRNCQTLHDVNVKIREQLDLKKSKWTIVNVKRLKNNIVILE